MEPTPPRKPRRPGATQSAAFYQKPETKKTSAEIVSEARLELQLGDRERVRAIRTSRPYTPLADQRTLFGKTNRSSAERPPSSFSLGSRHFEGAESRPVSGTTLPPLEHKPVLLLSTSPELVLPRPPLDPNRRPASASRSGSRRPLHRNASTDSRQDDGAHGRAGSFDETNHESQNLTRRAHSGPTERMPPSAAYIEGCASPAAMAAPRPFCSADGRSRHSEGSPTPEARPLAAAAAPAVTTDRQSDADYYDQCVRPILDMLTDQRQPAEGAATSCAHLYDALAVRGLLGKACTQRSTVLRTVFKLLDRDDVRLLLQVARVILALRVSGSNLTSVCKLVFKLSKDDSNDRFFLVDNTLELLLSAVADVDPASASETLVYALGSVKILAGSQRVSSVLVESGAVAALSSVLDKIICLVQGTEKPSERVAQLVVQLTGALRHLAGLSSAKQYLLNENVIGKLCSMAEFFVADADVVLNLASILSKLTVHADCCTALTACRGSFHFLLAALREHVGKEDHVVRLCFILGNLAARSDEARHKIHDEQDGVSIIMAAFEHYASILLKDTQDNHGSGSLTKVHDVLIKTIRVIANLSIDEGIGIELTTPRWKCLQQLLNVLDATSVESSEELVLNTMATINNLSYYAASRTPNSGYSLSLAKALLKLLLADNEPGMMEACRIYGNLTRQRQVRDFLARNSVPEIMVTLLDSGSRELVYSCCGVLINFMLDEDKRAILKNEGGIRKLIDVLRDFGCDDWQLSALVCQVLWNYSTKIMSCNATFGEEETMLLGKLLSEYLDPGFSNSSAAGSLGPDTSSVRQHMLWSWENEFCPVAQKLLHRVESNQSQFEDLDP